MQVKFLKQYQGGALLQNDFRNAHYQKTLENQKGYFYENLIKDKDFEGSFRPECAFKEFQKKIKTKMDLMPRNKAVNLVKSKRFKSQINLNSLKDQNRSIKNSKTTRNIDNSNKYSQRSFLPNISNQSKILPVISLNQSFSPKRDPYHEIQNGMRTQSPSQRNKPNYFTRMVKPNLSLEDKFQDPIEEIQMNIQELQITDRKYNKQVSDNSKSPRSKIEMIQCKSKIERHRYKKILKTQKDLKQRIVYGHLRKQNVTPLKTYVNINDKLVDQRNHVIDSAEQYLIMQSLIQNSTDVNYKSLRKDIHKAHSKDFKRSQINKKIMERQSKTNLVYFSSDSEGQVLKNNEYQYYND